MADGSLLPRMSPRPPFRLYAVTHCSVRMVNIGINAVIASVSGVDGAAFPSQHQGASIRFGERNLLENRKIRCFAVFQRSAADMSVLHKVTALFIQHIPVPDFSAVICFQFPVLQQLHSVARQRGMAEQRQKSK